MFFFFSFYNDKFDGGKYYLSLTFRSRFESEFPIAWSIHKRQRHNILLFLRQKINISPKSPRGTEQKKNKSAQNRPMAYKRLTFFQQYFIKSYILQTSRNNIGLKCKFVSKYRFNDLTNVTFHKSPNIAIATHMDHLHTTQKIHIY